MKPDDELTADQRLELDRNRPLTSYRTGGTTSRDADYVDETFNQKGGPQWVTPQTVFGGKANMPQKGGGRLVARC